MQKQYPYHTRKGLPKYYPDETTANQTINLPQSKTTAHA